jgi:hypothetical protein
MIDYELLTCGIAFKKPKITAPVVLTRDITSQDTNHVPPFAEQLGLIDTCHAAPTPFPCHAVPR